MRYDRSTLGELENRGARLAAFKLYCFAFGPSFCSTDGGQCPAAKAALRERVDGLGTFLGRHRAGRQIVNVGPEYTAHGGIVPLPVGTIAHEVHCRARHKGGGTAAGEAHEAVVVEIVIEDEARAALFRA